MSAGAGKSQNNRPLLSDLGRAAKINIISRYRFYFAFENSNSPDYVSEKVYDGLIAGTVPVYLGAPNVYDYLPADNCIFKVSDFGSAAELARYLMPSLRRRFPAARLLLVGRNPHPELRARARSGGIEIVANPDDATNYFAGADFAVMPLQRGGGTRIKALEAMAWGIPMIATRCAVEAWACAMACM